MCDHVVVSSSTGVMTREDGLECHDSVGIGLLNSSQECCVDVAFVICIAIPICNNTRIYAGSVAVPDILVEIRDGFACLDVHKLSFEDDRYTGLTFA